ALNMRTYNRHHIMSVKKHILNKDYISRQLHRQNTSALHRAARYYFAISSSGNTPNFYPPMPIQVFIFNRNQSIAQHRWIVVVGSHNPPLQGERPDDAPLIIVTLGRGPWPEVLELMNFREISVVHE